LASFLAPISGHLGPPGFHSLATFETVQKQPESKHNTKIPRKTKRNPKKPKNRKWNPHFKTTQVTSRKKRRSDGGEDERIAIASKGKPTDTNTNTSTHSHKGRLDKHISQMRCIPFFVGSARLNR